MIVASKTAAGNNEAALVSVLASKQHYVSVWLAGTRLNGGQHTLSLSAVPW